MEERIRALNQGRTVPVVSEGDMEELVELSKTDKIQSLRANMKDKMKKRRAQRRPTRTNLPTEFEGESEGLSAESELYKANLLQLQSTEDEHLEDVILSALKEAELERCEMQQARLLEMKMNESGLDEKERDLILAEYKSANERFKSNLDQQQSKQ
uniref:Uncharacterized protein n=1 Tax=Ciona savignyi TaxID=51511 RepID=H2ZPK8_CIOSA